MQAFAMETLLEERATTGRLYHEFLRVPALSAGVYVLPAGGTNPQQPHTEDEVYYIARGRARFTAGAEERAVEPGSVLYVAADVPHRFHDISEELVVLVFFAPASQRRA